MRKCRNCLSVSDVLLFLGLLLSFNGIKSLNLDGCNFKIEEFDSFQVVQNIDSFPRECVFPLIEFLRITSLNLKLDKIDDIHVGLILFLEIKNGEIKILFHSLHNFNSKYSDLLSKFVSHMYKDYDNSVDKCLYKSYNGIYVLPVTIYPGNHAMEIENMFREEWYYTFLSSINNGSIRCILPVYHLNSFMQKY